MKKNVHFIINPISGSGKQELTLDDIVRQLGVKDFNIYTKTSRYKHHAKALTKEAIEEKADIVVACGGDGTINEVASCLAGTPIPLGIVPLGSGNGLASHLKISKKVDKALKIIKNGHVCKIDVGRVNQAYFLSNIGIGFDCDVIHNYEKSSKRRLPAYIKAIYTSFRNYAAHDAVKISINGKEKVVRPFLLFVSNSNVMGYKMSLTPMASLCDGLLEVVLITGIKRYKLPYLLFLFLIKRMDLLKEVEHFTTKEIGISKNNGNPFKLQKDGELVIENTQNIAISVNSNFLSVIVPNSIG